MLARSNRPYHKNSRNRRKIAAKTLKLRCLLSTRNKMSQIQLLAAGFAQTPLPVERAGVPADLGTRTGFIGEELLELVRHPFPFLGVEERRPGKVRSGHWAAQRFSVGRATKKGPSDA